MSRDNADALQHATSKQRTNKHKRPGKVVSFKDSNGSDGCRLHIWATDHTTTECRVIQNQIDGMHAQYEAQPYNANKRQKINNNKPNQEEIYMSCLRPLTMSRLESKKNLNNAQ